MPSASLEAPVPRRSYFTRSKLKECWKAAGVLPFSFHQDTCWVLLGGEMVRTGPGGKFWQLMWRDFGGCREAMDEDAAATASRECSEETLGMLFGCSSADSAAVKLSTENLADHLRSAAHSMCAVHPLKQGAYQMFVCRAPFVDPLMFALALEQNAGTSHPVPGGQEKLLFAWVRMSDILRTVSKARTSYTLHSHQRIVARGPGLRTVPRRLLLHPCFACSVRIAAESGLLLLLKACRPVINRPPPSSDDASNQMELACQAEHEDAQHLCATGGPSPSAVPFLPCP